MGYSLLKDKNGQTISVSLFDTLEEALKACPIPMMRIEINKDNFVWTGSSRKYDYTIDYVY